MMQLGEWMPFEILPDIWIIRREWHDTGTWVSGFQLFRPKSQTIAIFKNLKDCEIEVSHIRENSK